MSDREREKNIYRYILKLLPLKKPNNLSEISEKLYSQKKSDPAKKIFNLIKEKENQPLPAKLTTEQLVELIKNVKISLQEEYQDKEKTYCATPKLLRKEDIITLLTYLIKLSSEERKYLNLSKSEVDIILGQNILNLYRYHTEIDKAKILDFYKSTISLSNINSREKSTVSNNETDIRKIRILVKQYLEHLGLEKWIIKDSKVEDLCGVIQRHIKRLKAQAGINEISSISDQYISDKYIKDFEQNCITDSFLERLVYSTIENYLIREQLPIYIQYFELTQLKPLPLYYPNDDYPEGLLNPQIIEPEKNHDNTSLASQHAYKATISFNLKIKNSLLEKIKQKLPEKVKATLVKDDGDGLVFTASSTGVGGHIAQLIKTINRVLFWDIECVREKYFPIAHDLVIHQEVIANNIASPVWSHNLVKLCSSKSLKEALTKGKYDSKQDHEYSTFDEIGTGDYCGFNFIESAIKSALQARLSAFLKSDINVEDYIENLSQVVANREILRVAESYLNYYPFSLAAMESYLTHHLLNQERQNDNQYLPYLYYDAYILIITAYLREGLYRKAFKKLKKIQELKNFDSDISKNIQDNFRIFSGSILAKYELCKAYYFYMCDDQDSDPNYRWSDLPNFNKAQFIISSWDSLKKAEDHLKIRLKKYAVINEISQGLFHPHFITLARINFLRAKIFFYFPSYVNGLKEIELNRSINQNNCCYYTIYYLELARIYAAKNGNTLDYACYTAYQSYAYIKNGYLINKKISFKNMNDVNFTRKECLKYSKNLLNEAVINYADFGRKCYSEIKDNSGINIEEDKNYGNLFIKSLPLIQEEFTSVNEVFKDKILHLDMSLLGMQKLGDSPEKLREYIYLFGAKAAIIFFARAMYQLCGSDHKDTDSLEKWRARLQKAYSLFNYAWAVAEDGCRVEVEDNGENSSSETNAKRTITRPLFEGNPPKYKDLEPEAKSILDMYPHRQSEIADLGKVFAAGCLIIMLYIVNSEEKEKVRDKITSFKGKIQYKERNPDRDELILNQPELNGHLREYLNNAKEKIDRFTDEAFNHDDSIEAFGVTRVRDKIVKSLLDSNINNE